ncbi:MAG: restriction endonuclease subunit S, partial [Candidatus Schekmanbacteria bacterium]
YTLNAHLTYIPKSKRNKLCDEYDIMMDKYGEAGKVRFGLKGAYNVALAKITPIPPLTKEHLRWFLKQSEIQQLIEASAVASTRASVNKVVFRNLKILLPPKGLLEKFENIGKLYIDNYLKLQKENQKLATIRDLLLPKLVGGEIRV